MTTKPILACMLPLLTALLSGPVLHAQEADQGLEPGREKFVVIKAGTVITVAGDEIDDGEIVIVDGKIRLIGTQLEYPASAEVIDARDQIVMPGFVNARTRAGQRGGGGGVSAHRLPGEDYYADELDTENLLEHGFTTVGIYSAGRGIPGRTSVHRTAGSDHQQPVGDPSYIRINMINFATGKGQFKNALKQARAEIEKVKKAREEWEKKQKEQAEKAKKEAEQEQKEGDGNGNGNGEEQEEEKPAEFKPPRINPAVEPIVHWIKGELETPPIIEVGNASGVVHAYDVLDDQEEALPYHLFLSSAGTHDLDYILDDLVENEELVMLMPVETEEPQSAMHYCLAAELAFRDMEMAFLPRFDSEGGFERYRWDIAEARRWGVSRERALRAMTINPAKMLGIDSRVGTLEKDKDADIVFFDRDPLNPLSRMTRVMILGETVWEDRDDDARAAH